jgi:hypothetical protein
MSQETLFNLLTWAPLVIVVAVLIYQLPKFLMARRWRQHKAATVDKWQAAGVKFTRGPVGGQCGGLESRGAAKVASNVGYVALTDQEVRLTRVTPEGVWCIPFKQIKGVTLQGDFLGQSSRKVPFIVVRFSQDGQTDKLGFKVKDYPVWAKEIAKAARVSLKGQWKPS